MKPLLTYAILIPLMFITVKHVTADLTDDLVVYFTFDNVENKRVLDESGNNLNAQIIKNAVLAKGKYGKAIRITRETEDCVNLPAFDALNINHRITMMAWVYHEDWTETSAQLFDKGCYSRGTNVYGMGVFNKKHHPDIDAFGIDSGIALILANNEVQKSITADNKLQKRVWHHIASTASLDARRIYLNGEVILESTDGFVFSGTNTENLRIGCAKDEPQYAFKGGSIDEIALWRRTLSEAEVRAAMWGPLLAVSPEGKVATTWGNIKRKSF